jgi:hypothetical protein
MEVQGDRRSPYQRARSPTRSPKKATTLIHANLALRHPKNAPQECLAGGSW